MAFPFEALQRENEPEALFGVAIAALKGAGLVHVIDAAFIDDDDVKAMCGDASVCEVILMIRERAVAFKKRLG